MGRLASLVFCLLLAFSFTPVHGESTSQTACFDWFLYHTDQSGDWEIFRSTDRPDHAFNLTGGVGERVYDVGPSLSPDRAEFTFASSRDDNWEIYVGSTSELSVRRITTAKDTIDVDPTWSPTGNWIAYESGRAGNWDIALFDLAAGTSALLTNDPANDINPSWSPDGSSLLFQSDRDGLWQIYRLNPASGEVVRLSDGMGDDHDAMFSPDGSQIVFRSYRDSELSRLYVMSVDGSNVRLISDSAGDATNAVWSPDGTMIAYQSDLDGDLDIYVYQLTSGQTRLVTMNDVFDYAPSWRCDSSSVLFTSDVMGDSNIYETAALPIDAMPILVESGARALTSSPANEQYPLLSPSEENASRQGSLPERH